MIRVRFLRHETRTVGIECSGHAGYAEAGQDIVCSAVSALVTALCNGMTEIAGIPARVSDNGEKLVCRVETELDPQQEHDAALLFDTFECAMDGIRREYGQYLKINDTEV